MIDLIKFTNLKGQHASQIDKLPPY